MILLQEVYILRYAYKLFEEMTEKLYIYIVLLYIHYIYAIRFQSSIQTVVLIERQF